VLGPKRTSKCEEFASFFCDAGVFLRSYLEATPFAQKLLTRNKSWSSTCIYDSSLTFDLHKRIALENYFAIVDSGRFDYAKYPDRFKNFNEPDPSYHGLVFAQALGVGSAFGANLSYIFKIRLQLLRDIGAAVSPFNAWLLAQGLETLSLRMERHIQNAQEIAKWLESHASVEKVNYASLPSSKYNALAKKYSPAGSGSVLSFELKGGVEAGKKFVESLKLFSHVANIGDVRSLVIHPATTTHSQLSADEQLAAGVTPGLVRLSLGLENINDIKADLEVGFKAAKG
jgi:O-acetylhomoserine (thiol)-lyase